MTKAQFFTRIRSRRGVAMESAVVFLLIILSLCTLMLTLSLMGRHQLKNNHNEILADIEKEQIVEDFLAYVSAVTVIMPSADGEPTPSPSTPPAEGTDSFYNYLKSGNNAAIAQRRAEYYDETTGKYSCFDTRTQDPATGEMTFTLYALNSQTNELILCAEATKTAEQVQADGSVKQGTVTLKYCLSRKP